MAYLKAPLLDGESQHNTRKVGIALLMGSSLLLLGIMAMHLAGPTSHDTSAAESTSLFGMPTSLRQPSPVLPMTIRNLPGNSRWKDLTIATMEAANRCDRDPSMSATPLKAAMAKMSSADRDMVVKADAAITAKAQDLLKAGVVAPLGFFDPLGLATKVEYKQLNGKMMPSTGTSDARLLFYREAEIKHGRVCMLAVLGTIVGEQVHPLLGGADVSGVAHFQSMVPDVSLDTFWKAAFLQNLAAITFFESKSLATINIGGYADLNDPSGPDAFSMKDLSRMPGDLGFDPLGLKPKTEKDLLTLQNKEILNGRLAMIAAAGIIAQELVTGEKVFR